MRILQVSSHYVPAYSFGGPLQVAHALGKEWVKAGHEVTVCCTNLKTPEDDLEVATDAPVLVDGITVWYESVTLSRYYGFSPPMYRRLKTLVAEADLVIVHFHYQFAGWAGARIARKLGKPYVVFAHGCLRTAGLSHKSAILKLLYLGLMERRSFREALRIVFGNAEEMQESLWRKHGIVMRNSIDPAQLAGESDDAETRFPAIRGKTKFLFLGRLDVKQKGLDYLLASFSKAARLRDNVVLILAGPDERGDRQVLRELIARHGVGQKILFTGLISGTLKTSMLTAADVFVQPSRFEGGSVALVEALYLGLPVVVTRGAGLSREIQDNQLGMVVAPGDELTHALEAMMDPEVRQRYAGRGRQFVLDNLVWQKTAASFLLEIQKLLPAKLNLEPQEAG
jgi:glycosyltransferase involved in cell wall biosynthesis